MLGNLFQGSGNQRRITTRHHLPHMAAGVSFRNKCDIAEINATRIEGMPILRAFSASFVALIFCK